MKSFLSKIFIISLLIITTNLKAPIVTPANIVTTLARVQALSSTKSLTEEEKAQLNVDIQYLSVSTNYSTLTIAQKTTLMTKLLVLHSANMSIATILPDVKDLAHKYKLNSDQTTLFSAYCNYISDPNVFSNLTTEQVAIFKEAINLALYGMVFEESLGSNWTTFQTALSASSGTQAEAKPTDNNFTSWINFLVTEIGRYETLSAEDCTKLLAEGKLTPIIGEDGFIAKLTDLVSRRMEATLDTLKTTEGLTIQATTKAGDTNKTDLTAGNAYEGYLQLKLNILNFVPMALEDPSKSWDKSLIPADAGKSLKELINRTLRVVSVIKSANLNELTMALNKLILQLNQPITVDERIISLKRLLDTMVISNKTGDDINFEIRLLKIIDSLSSAATTEQKKAILDLINQFSIIGQKSKDLLADYIRILTQGRHPKEIFKNDQKIALLWNEIDGSEPKQKYWLNSNDSTKKIILKTNDILDSEAQFKIKITTDAEVVIYKESEDKKLILDNNGSLTEGGEPESPNDNQKFYVYGSSSALSFRSKDSTFGFLTVTFDKKLNCKINDKPAGKTNPDGSLEPGTWAIFKAVDLGALHEKLSTIRISWPTTAEWADKATVTPDTTTPKIITNVTKILSNYSEQNVFMANNGLIDDGNAFVFLTEIANFFDKGFRVTPEQWDWFLSSELNAKATELVGNIERTMGQILNTGGQAKTAFQTLKEKLTLPPQATLEPHENAPKNGSVVTLFIQNGNDEKFMRVVEETDARGTHYFLKADLIDPVDPRCHLNVIAQGNILAFSFLASDNTKKTLQFVPRTDSELSRLWADEIGRNNIKIMSRLEFKEMGKGDINSKDRYNEQFQMDYVDKTTKDLVYNLDSIGQGAGILRIDPESGYATAVKDENNKLIPTFKADSQTGIKILPISGFLTELGSLRNETDPIKVINGYTAKIDIAETNQDLEFLIMEFEDFIEKTQTKRADWLKLLMRKDFSEAMAQFLDKIKPKAETNTDLTTALTNMKQTYVQTTTQLAGKTISLAGKTIAIKWTSPDGQEWYLKDDGTSVAFTSDNFADPACQFVFDYKIPQAPIKFDPIKCALNIKRNIA